MLGDQAAVRAGWEAVVTDIPAEVQETTADGPSIARVYDFLFGGAHNLAAG